MNDKIPIFAGVPASELSKLSGEKTDTTDYTKLRGIEREFEQTNLHTKQTPVSGGNTDNTGNTLDKDNISANTGEAIAKEKKNRLGKLMGGTFAVDLVDMLIPSLTILLVNYLGYQLDKKDLQLSKSEKEALSPAVQDVLDEIDIDFNNPWINLGVMLSIVYGSKIIDKLPTMKKKVVVKEEKKKGMSEAVSEIISESGEQGEEITDMGKFEIDYGKLVDEIRLSRKRGVGDAKEYLCKNYPEKIKAIAKKHGIGLSQIHDKLNFIWTVKKREKPEDFKLE